MRTNFILPLIGFLGFLMACSSSEDSSNANNKETNASKEGTPMVDTDKNKKDADTLLAYKHVRAVYTDFEFGDLPHFIFNTAAGESIDFNIINDRKMEQDLFSFDKKNGEYVANPKYIGKMFDIYYKIEQHDLMDSGQPMDVEVAYLLKLVE